FSGAVLVAHDGSPFFRKAYGLASRGHGTLNRPDTRFNLGSINKIFTRTAIEQLARAGKLRLTDTIDRYVPRMPRRTAQKITIAELLEHQGGVGDIFNERYSRADRSRLRTVADWLPLFADDSLLFEPGTQTRYSNAGYVLLGAVIEAASGQGYYDYIREHIYK